MSPRLPVLLALGLLLAGWGGAVSGCSRRETLVEDGRRTGTLHVALGAEPGGLDPQRQITADEMQVSLALFEGLAAIDERSSRPVPAVAESWTPSADGLTWTFHLRRGLQWSDGASLTADDFAWSLRRALSPQLASEYAYLLFVIRGAEAFNAGRQTDPAALGVRALDPLTLELTLERPVPHLPAILAQPVAFPVPRQALETAAGGRPWPDPARFVGNGPFVLTEWTPNQRLVTTRNPHFREPARLHALVFHPYEQATAQEAAFRTGLLHITSDLPAARIAGYRAEKSAALRIEPLLETNFLRLNTTRPPLDDLRVRRALALAVDRRALVDRATLGGQPPAIGLVPSGTAGYPTTEGRGYEPETARRLLAEAGFPGGHGFPALEAMGFTSDTNQKVLEALQQMWQRELSIAVTLAPKEKQIWVADERRLAYQISLARWIGDYVDPSTFLELFLSGGGNNATGWANPDYDRLVREGSSEPDPARRIALFQQAEALLLRDQPAVPLYHGTHAFLIRPEVRGWEPALLGFVRYQHVWLE